MHIYSLILMQTEHWKLGSYANNLIGLGRIMEYPGGTHKDEGPKPWPCTDPPARGDQSGPQGVPWGDQSDPQGVPWDVCPGFEAPGFLSHRNQPVFT